MQYFKKTVQSAMTLINCLQLSKWVILIAFFLFDGL